MVTSDSIRDYDYDYSKHFVLYGNVLDTQRMVMNNAYCVTDYNVHACKVKLYESGWSYALQFL